MKLSFEKQKKNRRKCVKNIKRHQEYSTEILKAEDDTKTLKISKNKVYKLVFYKSIL